MGGTFLTDTPSKGSDLFDKTAHFRHTFNPKCSETPVAGARASKTENDDLTVMGMKDKEIAHDNEPVTMYRQNGSSTKQNACAAGTPGITHGKRALSWVI
jgi:hypothetical protein